MLTSLHISGFTACCFLSAVLFHFQILGLKIEKKYYSSRTNQIEIDIVFRNLSNSKLPISIQKHTERMSFSPNENEMLSRPGWRECSMKRFPLGFQIKNVCFCVDCPSDESCGGLWRANRFPLPGKENESDKEIHIVLSHCKSDISWLSTFTQGYKISSMHVITKCGRAVKGAPADAVIIELPNIGRCDHTYAYYINHVLDRKKEGMDLETSIVFFLKDDMSATNIHQIGNWTDFATMLRLASSTNGFACGLGGHTSSSSKINVDNYSAFHEKNSLFNFRIEEYNRNTKGYKNDSVAFQSNFTNFGSFYDFYFQIPHHQELVQVCYGGVFAASYQNIKNVDSSMWENVEKALSRGNNIQEGHYMERAWASLLATPDLQQYQIEALRSYSAPDTAPFPYTGALVTIDSKSFHRCWNNLIEQQKKALKGVGFNRIIWNHNMWPPGMYPRHWKDLHTKQHSALISVGYTKQIWEKMIFKHWKCEYSTKYRRRNNGLQSLARIFVFHKGTKRQLRSFLEYHSKVFGLTEIVVIAHNNLNEGKIAGADITTEKLRYLMGVGTDVWQCTGDLKYKGEMISHVIHHYSSYTDFVFPLEDEEYISFREESEDISEDGVHEESITWNRKDFANTLRKLKITGKPFKMEDAEIDWNTLHDLSRGRKVTLLSQRATPLQTIICNWKSFMRGKEFRETDAANMFGGNKIIMAMCLLREDSLKSQMDVMNSTTHTNLLLLRLKQ